MGEAFCVCVWGGSIHGLAWLGGAGYWLPGASYGCEEGGCECLRSTPPLPLPQGPPVQGGKEGWVPERTLCLGTRRDPLASTFPGYVPGSQAWWLRWVPHFVCIKSP